MNLTPTLESIPSSILQDLNGHHPVTDDQIAFLRENGYVKIKNVLKPETVQFFGEKITEQVKLLNILHLPMEQRTTYQKAFLQIMNIWTEDETVKTFSFAPKLARLAAELMEVSGVRMYHDQALYKEPSGGITPWHADQYYWPVVSDRTITAWIPLQQTELEMGPLAFARKTHRMAFGRELEIGDDSEQLIQKSLKEAQADIDETPYDIGEVSFHFGWTFHRAGANTSSDPRRVMTMIYMDEDIRIAPPKNKMQETDLEMWCDNVEVGQLMTGPLNPVLWSEKSPNEI
jgi:ectoine hydroxylase-related dioxygenase (phytanoyl-CoA dioxygenase family)